MAAAAAALAAALVLLLAAVGLSPRAEATTLPLEPVPMSQQTFDAAGNPLLVANLAPDGSVVPRWSACAPGGASCTPSGRTGKSLEAGPTPVGTVFLASGTRGAMTYLARSSAWQGTVAATAPPSLAGMPRVGRRVTAAAGAWSGGWGGELDVVSLVVCRTPDGRGCTTIAHPWASPPPGDSIVLDARWTGRHLFAYDARYAKDTTFPAIGYLSPAGVPVPAVGATVARSAPLGPVTGPGTVTMRQQWKRLPDGRVLVGRATCPRGCVVVTTIANGRRGAAARIRVRGSRRLAVAVDGLAPLSSLTARVRLGRTPVVEARLLPSH